MTLDQVVEKFRKFPKYMQSGAGKMSRRFKCSKETIKEAKRIVRGFKNPSLPKILVFDIETSPTISYTWRRFKENISLDQVIQDPIMLTWSAKWLYGTEIMSDKITVEEVKKFDDYRIVKSLWDLINEADMVVAHYGNGFDVPMMNARAILNGLPPYSVTTSIDTKKEASKVFRFPSNKLDALGEYFGVGKKIKTDFMLWRRCLEGEQAAIDEMSTYNDQDVVVLEEVYLKLRPYIKAHPNVGLYLESDKPVCSNCGSDHLHTEGSYYTNTGRYTVYRCECGAMSRVRSSNYPKNVRKQLLTSVAK
jgi:uncharacterized protein YprB with RNaseH-like and TPR domain